jgi:hypothetical protein
MSLTFFAPSRTVLLVADEALYIYSASARGARHVETIPWEADNFEQNVAGVLAKDCGGKPVLILNDMVEQHYRKERVIRAGIGALDKANMIRRKLGVAFPNYPVRAAYPLKEKMPKTDKRGAADIYIFAAIPGSAQFVKTIEATKRSLASIAGFCLLPVESSDMVRELSARLGKGKRSKAKWAVFIGQHRHGGLRQIVTKDGELALTRMTPISDNIEDGNAWAGEVYQEFKATMSYLSRFGYQAEDGLDVIVMADSAVGDALEDMIEEECTFASITVMDAARLLNIPLGRQEGLHYADPLHVAWAGRKPRFILPMHSAQIDQVSKPRRAAAVASVLLLAGAVFFGYQFFGQMQALSTINGAIEDGRAQSAQLGVQYQKEVKRKEGLGFDVRLVQSSMAVHTDLEKNNIKVLDLLNGIGKAMGRDMRLDSIIVQKPDQNAIAAFMRQGKAEPLFEATLQMTYPSTTNIDIGNQEVRDLRGRLQTLLPDRKIEVTKFLKDYEYVEEIVVESGDLEKEDIQQDFIAEIKITGEPKP